jgi:excisionase family DNA binding protein
MSPVSNTDDLRVRARRLKRRKQAHRRTQLAKQRRAEAIATGVAPTLTLQEYSALRGLSPATVRRRIASGALTAFRDGGRLLIPRAALDVTGE